MKSYFIIHFQCVVIISSLLFLFVLLLLYVLLFSSVENRKYPKMIFNPIFWWTGYYFNGEIFIGFLLCRERILVLFEFLFIFGVTVWFAFNFFLDHLFDGFIILRMRSWVWTSLKWHVPESDNQTSIISWWRVKWMKKRKFEMK